MIRPIEMICIHDEDGQIRPYRFRIHGETGELVTVQVKRIVDKKEEKVASEHYMIGANCLIYYCQCILHGMLRTFEIRFRKDTCRWYLTGIR